MGVSSQPRVSIVKLEGLGGFAAHATMRLDLNKSSRKLCGNTGAPNLRLDRVFESGLYTWQLHPPLRSALRLDPMPKSICVYLHDADPAIDSFRFRISRDEAHHRVERLHAARWIRSNAIQLKPPPDWIPQTRHTGLFGEVWRVKSSDHFLVWQMEKIL